jgi:aromatic-L-amino-acid decarboxylase
MENHNPEDKASGTNLSKTLDPDDWNEFRKLGHQMLDDICGHLSTLRDRPVWQAMPDEVKQNLIQPLPVEGQGPESAYQEFLQNVLPYPNGNIHPRFWGWVQGTGTPLAMLAEMLAAAMNPHMAGFNQAPVLVEQQVIAWMAELMGMPIGTSGILTSGGTMASNTALIVARYAKAGFDVREMGLQGKEHPRLLMYGSTETHSWAERAAELLGLGTSAYRQAPVDSEFRVNVDELRRMIVEDRRAGHRPFCVIGTAGTINTGATDNLQALAALCREENLWFHVDGAFGALARLVPSLQPIVAGIELADSIALDLHKWMYLPFEIACVLIRDEEMHRRAFARSASYLAETTRGVIAGGLPFAERGIELTRGFKALKAWMCLKAYGIKTLADMIEQNVQQARYIATLIREHPDLELLAPVPLNTVCFRYRSDGLSVDELNELNEELLIRVQESGVAVPSSTKIDGAFALRVAIVNHRSRREDFDLLVEAVVQQGAQLVRERSVR